VPAPHLLLASASPRRRQLLQGLGVEFSCVAADIDETPAAREAPADYVQRMAQEKARAVAARPQAQGCLVLGADTTVVVEEDILGKPADHMQGLAMLARLSGREHQVLTAVCLLGPRGAQTELVQTAVEFVTLDRATCEAYLATDEPWDKAGAYAIQGLGGALVRAIHGSYSNVVGLPLAQTRALLAANGVVTALDPSAGA
tara:strand:- start:639 stop:1241 length:603 start_codon:yes stop_codon:yes gene_type:complete